jgi:hypothetical protein
MTTRRLSQQFGKRSKPFNGYKPILESLIATNQLDLITTLSGTQVFFPAGTIATLSLEAIRTFEAMGLTPVQAERIRATRAKIRSLENDKPPELPIIPPEEPEKLEQEKEPIA